MKKTVIALKHKAHNAKYAVSQTAKDRALQCLAGISKIELPEPPFPHLLHSNIPPSDSEALIILKVVSRVQETIQEHGPADRMTKYQFNRACQFVHAHKGVLSVIRRIPPELLQEIFILVAAFPEGLNIPWALSQVCQLWRTTALSVSVLWSRLPTIHLRKDTPQSFLPQIGELLVRSRDAPIHIYIYSPYGVVYDHPIIDILVLHSERWQSVTIDSTTVMVSALKGVKGRLSSLKMLSLTVFPSPGVVGPFDMFEDAPQLRSVNMDGPHPGDIRLPFSQLTHYRERLMGGTSTIALATSLTTLETVRCAGSPNMPIVTFPFLLILKVNFEGLTQEFLENLTLPAIRVIWTSGFCGHLITILTTMISHSHSPCLLQKLTLRTSELDPGELTRLLRLTPHLVYLDLPLPPPEDLTNLIIRQNKRPLVPLLEMLIFQADALRPTETGQILNALAVSRCNSLRHNSTSTISRDVRNRHVLEELRIDFQSPRSCHYELRFLENWLQSETSEQLEMLKEKLIQELPELEQGRSARKRKLKGCDKVLDILSEIQRLQIKNVNDIYVRYDLSPFFHNPPLIILNWTLKWFFYRFQEFIQH